jgi:hypothetical protein
MIAKHCRGMVLARVRESAQPLGGGPSTRRTCAIALASLSLFLTPHLTRAEIIEPPPRLTIEAGKTGSTSIAVPDDSGEGTCLEEVWAPREISALVRFAPRCAIGDFSTEMSFVGATAGEGALTLTQTDLSFRESFSREDTKITVERGRPTPTPVAATDPPEENSDQGEMPQASTPLPTEDRVTSEHGSESGAPFGGGLIAGALAASVVTFFATRWLVRRNMAPEVKPTGGDGSPPPREPPASTIPLAIPTPFPQRPVRSSESFELREDPIWRPGLPIVPLVTDVYAVIDEWIGGIITLAVSNWPNVDRGGRLRFGQSWSIGVDAEEFGRAVVRWRSEFNQPVPDRPLRIGDAFLVRALNEGSPETWGTIVDVSSDARAATKVALAAATAPALPEQFAIPEDDDNDEGPPVQGNVASPEV